MFQNISLNGKIVAAEDGSIAAVSSASLYGKGVFTTIAVINSRPWLWEKHWVRLLNDSAKIGIETTGIDEQILLDDLLRLIDDFGKSDVKARITLIDESSGMFWPSRSDKKTSVLITVAQRSAKRENLRLGLSSFTVSTTSKLSGVKSCNYLESIMAFDETRAAGFDEAVRLNDRGEITSGCMSNIFWLRDDKLFTPSVTTGCLAGTTREFILEHLPCDEVEVTIDELDNADAIFVSSAGFGVGSVVEYQNQELEPSDHEIIRIVPF